jgi:hypothetical protein
MANNPPRQPMFDWLNGVPIADLAAELMAALISDPQGWEHSRGHHVQAVCRPTGIRSRRWSSRWPVNKNVGAPPGWV